MATQTRKRAVLEPAEVPPPFPGLLSRKAAAAKVGKSLATLWSWTRRGVVPAKGMKPIRLRTLPLGREVWIEETALLEFMRAVGEARARAR